MLHTSRGQGLVLCWPTEEPGRWVLGRHACTYQSGWLSIQQLQDPSAASGLLPDLLAGLWSLAPRPLDVRPLRAYTHLPPLRWKTPRALELVLRGHTPHTAVMVPTPQAFYLPGDDSPAYRHPHVRSRGPIVPGAVVVVDLPVDRGCPVYTGPSPVEMAANSHVGFYRGGLQLLVVATSGAAAFTVDTRGRYGWIYARILRHLDERPGVVLSPCPVLFPVL
jgi:hypothetical protein